MRKYFVSLRRLKKTADGCGAPNLIQADHVIALPSVQNSVGEVGMVTVAFPSSRRPVPIMAPSAGTPGFFALFPFIEKSYGGWACSEKWYTKAVFSSYVPFAFSSFGALPVLLPE